MSDKPFFEKIKDIGEESSQIVQIEQQESQMKTELLIFLKNQMAKLESKDELRLSVTSELIRRMTDEKDTISTATLIKLLEVLDTSETDRVGNILNVLKQQIVLQQNNFGGDKGGGAGSPPVGSNKEIPISKEEYNTAKRVFELVEKLKGAEGIK